MTELINSDIFKLISILLAIVALFYIGMKNKPTSGLNKSFHLWYICGITVFIVIELVTCIIVGNVEAVNIMNYISFAATLASLILSVLAIFMTVLSGESMNKLRDSMIGLGDVSSKVESTLNSTMDEMQLSAQALNQATKDSNDKMKNLDAFIDTKIKEIENHIISKLDSHQKTTLKAINDSILDKNNTTPIDSQQLSDKIVQNFMTNTSNASISLLYMINEYCVKMQAYGGKQPVVKLSDMATAINGGKKEERFSMYLYACLVLLSSFGLLEYETIQEQFSDVKFKSIAPAVVKYLVDQATARNLNSELEVFAQYIDSLFNDNTQEVNNDGTEIDKN